MSAEVQSSKGPELLDQPLSHGDHTEVRLLEPVATVVRGVYRLFLVGLVAGAMGPLFGTKLGLIWGGPNVCADSSSDFSTDGSTGRFRPHAGSRS